MGFKTQLPQTNRRKQIIWASALLLAYTLIGFFAVPAIIKWQMLKQLPGITKRTVAVEQVKFNPYALSLTIRGLKISEANQETFAGFEEFYANFELSSIFQWAIVFKEISVKKHFAQVTMLADGTFNFSNLLSANPSPAPSGPRKPLPKLIVGELNIEGGAIAFSDLTRKAPFHTKIGPMKIHLADFRTHPDTKNPYSFTAQTDSGESLDWTGNITVEPLKSNGSFKLAQIEVKKYSPYLHDYARFDVVSGKVSVAADYNVELTTNGLAATVAKAEVAMDQLELKDSVSGETVVTIPSLTVKNTEASLGGKAVHVGAVQSSGASIFVRENQDGTINLLSALEVAKSVSTNRASTHRTPAKAEAPWIIKVDDVALDNWSIKLEDRKFAKQGIVKLDQLALHLKEIVLPASTPIRISLTTRVNEMGTVNITGAAVLSPLSAEMDLNVSNFTLAPFQPFVDEHLKLAITDGNFNSIGHVGFSATNSPTITFKGGVEVKQFASADQSTLSDLLKFDSFKASGADIALVPNRFHVDEIKLVGLKTSISVSSNKAINLLAILPEKLSSITNATVVVVTNSAPRTAVPAIGFPIELTALVLENASFHFSDESIQPRCNFSVQEFGGSIKGLSTKVDQPAELDIRGKVDERSTFSVTGKLRPLSTNLLADIAIKTKTAGLTPFTSYTEKFAGYPLNKGNLSLDLHYDLHERKLKAENKIEIDQFTFGAKNNSPDATKLPVKLAIALLKDRNGKIELDVPLSGSLDDPKFKVGPIIMQVFMNILTKAATSPFSLLGAVFGGGEELSFIEFTAGSTEISPSESAKLEKLEKALYDRPALSLEIVGSSDPAKDRVEIARRKVQEQIKTLRVKELIRSGSTAQNAATNILERPDYERLVAKAFRDAAKSKEGLAAAPVIPIEEPAATKSAASVSQSAPARTKPAAVAKAPATKITVRGAEYLSTQTIVVKPIAKPILVPAVEVKAEEPKPIPASGKLTVEEMAQVLADRIEVTNADLQELMRSRAQKVESFLLKAGRIPAERLFILQPKTGEKLAPSLSRVNLSLN